MKAISLKAKSVNQGPAILATSVSKISTENKSNYLKIFIEIGDDPV